MYYCMSCALVSECERYCAKCHTEVIQVEKIYECKACETVGPFDPCFVCESDYVDEIDQNFDEKCVEREIIQDINRWFACSKCERKVGNLNLCSECGMEFIYEIEHPAKESVIQSGADCVYPCCGCGMFLSLTKDEVNCRIVRCGVLSTGQCPPHASKEAIQLLMKSGNWRAGCGAAMRYNPELDRLEECGHDT